MNLQLKRSFMNKLSDKESICFGPFMGELGWELFRWAGFIRNFKTKNPNKKIFCSTRKGREDIYYGSIDDIHTFKIQGDYISARANMYRCDFINCNEYKRIMISAKNKFRTAFFIEPPKNISYRNFFSYDEMDFNFTPRRENLKVIKSILQEHTKRIPICISPRYRIDSLKPTRNWKKEYWNVLFTIIKQTNKYLAFILGDTKSIIVPEKDKSFIVLEEIRANKTSNIGLTIEAIKNSALTIGQQSALPILSNYLKTPVISWGHEKIRHQILENPMNTKCIFFEELSINYNTSPNLIFEAIVKET